MVGTAEAAGRYTGANRRADHLAGAYRPDKALGAGHHVGVGNQPCDLRIDLVCRLFLCRMHPLQRFLVGGVFVHELGRLVQLALQLVLLLAQLGFLGLHLGLLRLDVLPRLLHGGDEGLVVLGHLIDEFHAVEQVDHAGGLEEDGEIAEAAALLLAAHLLAEQLILLLLQQLVAGDLGGGIVDLVLGVVDLLQQQLVALIQQILGDHDVLFLGLGLGDLLFQILELFLLLLLLLLQRGDLSGLALLLLQLRRSLGGVGRADGAGSCQRQQGQNGQKSAEDAFCGFHA